MGDGDAGTGRRQARRSGALASGRGWAASATHSGVRRKRICRKGCSCTARPDLPGSAGAISSSGRRRRICRRACSCTARPGLAGSAGATSSGGRRRRICRKASRCVVETGEKESRQDGDERRRSSGQSRCAGPVKALACSEQIGRFETGVPQWSAGTCGCAQRSARGIIPRRAAGANHDVPLLLTRNVPWPLNETISRPSLRCSRSQPRNFLPSGMRGRPSWR